VTLSVVSSTEDYLQIEVCKTTHDTSPGHRGLARIRIAKEHVMGLLGGRVTPCEFEVKKEGGDS
jgi:hypothetical protein